MRYALTLVLLAVSCGGPLEEGPDGEDLNGKVRIRLVSGNLSTGNNQSWTAGEGLRSSIGSRAPEGNELASDIAHAVPAGDYVAIGGDFNTSARTETVIANLAGTVVTTAPWPADESGNANTNFSRAKPYDWVLVNP